MYEKLYQYVLEVAKSGSITTAANKLYITPSTLSKAVQKLETDLGLQLFDRMGKNFVPTYAGTQFLARAREIVDLQTQLVTEMSDIARLQKGLLRIGLQLNAPAPALKAVASFHQSFPQVEIHIEEGSGSSLQKLLDDGMVDLTITNIDEQSYADREIMMLQHNELVLVVPNGHPLVRKAVWSEQRKYPIVSPSACEGEMFILPFPRQRVRVILEEYFHSRGLQLSSSICATSIGSILTLVSMGLGITASFDSDAYARISSLGLTILGFDTAPVQRSLGLSYRSDCYLSEAAKAFSNVCVQSFQNDREPPLL